MALQWCVIGDAIRESPVQFWQQCDAQASDRPAADVPSLFASGHSPCSGSSVRWIIWCWAARLFTIELQREISRHLDGCAAHQSLWPDRSHDRCNRLCGLPATRLARASRSAVRSANYAGLCSGRRLAAGAGGGCGGALHCGRRAGARLSGARRADGGAVCCGPVRTCGEPDVPHRGFGALALGRGSGLSRARRRAGEAARASGSSLARSRRRWCGILRWRRRR